MIEETSDRYTELSEAEGRYYQGIVTIVAEDE
jgi:hypothetical protein